MYNWLIDGDKVLQSNRHKIGRFGDNYVISETIYSLPISSLVLRKQKPKTKTLTQPFYSPFSGTHRVSWCQKRSSELYRAMEDNRGRHIDHLDGRHSIRTNQRCTSIISHVYAGCPDCRKPATLSCLRTGTKYVGMVKKHNKLSQKYTIKLG